jgi:sugar/nucleoside kinase (ribokinase family)
MGMLILDEIRIPNRPPLVNIIGGSATFVALGLRLFASKTLPLGCLVLAGSDFPEEVRDEVRSWGTDLILRTDTNKLSSRGLLIYKDDTFGPKTFEYTTPPIRTLPEDLVVADNRLLGAKAFHFFGTPEEILEQVPELLRLRQQFHAKLPKPFIVWEPLPSACTPSQRDKLLKACKLVDVFSPNHLELTALFDEDRVPRSDGTDPLGHFSRLGSVFLDNGVGPDGTGTLVIRASGDGAIALQRNASPIQVPAFYKPNAPEVVDPTGAGNAFLGGYIAGWLREGDVKEALCYGAVAASFALEQIGLPRSEDVSGQVGERRLEEFRQRLRESEEAK